MLLTRSTQKTEKELTTTETVDDQSPLSPSRSLTDTLAEEPSGTPKEA